MNVRLVNKALILFVVTLSLVACGSALINKPDISVDAGDDQEITLPVEYVWLTGKAEIEKHHRFRSTQWSQISGPVQLQLKAPKNLSTEIVNLSQAGRYQFRLTVTDHFNRSRFDDVTINVIDKNSAPVVTLKKTRIEASQGSLVVIDASAVDDSNTQLQLQWEITAAPAQSDFSLNAPQALQQKFLAPKETGEYHLKLTATDQAGLSNTGEVIIEVKSLAQTIGPQLSLLITQLYEKYKDSLANLAFSVSFYDHDYVWQGSAGVASVENQSAMTTEHPIRIASITKTMVAYLAMRLVEEEYFSLDTPLGELLADNDLPNGYGVADLHTSNGVKRGDKLTVRQLLDQSTGIRDHISYVSDPLALDTISMIEALTQNNDALPDVWTPDLIVTNIFERGLTSNLNSLPGQSFIYGNSNSDILGIVMEVVTGTPLHELLQQYVFVPLDMHNSYLEWHDPSRSAIPVDHFFAIDERVVGTGLPTFMYGNHNINQLNVNTSFAWAGGGVVSTLNDVQKFLQAIAVYDAKLNSDLTEQWHTWKGASNQPDDSYYALGRINSKFDIGERSYQLQGHNGAWGSAAYNISPLNIGIVTWDSHANIDAGGEFTQQLIGLLAQIGYQAQVE